jgi:hypothetical protein
VWLHLIRHDERDEVADLGGDNGAASLVGAVAEVGKAEDDEEGDPSTDRGQCVGCDPVEAEGPTSDKSFAICLCIFSHGFNLGSASVEKLT